VIGVRRPLGYTRLPKVYGIGYLLSTYPLRRVIISPMLGGCLARHAAGAHFHQGGVYALANSTMRQAQPAPGLPM